MKISLSKMLPVLLLLVSFSAMSQDSLAINSKCDSLKAAYEAKLEEWKEIETNFKTLYEKYKNYNDSNIERYEPEYDSLKTLYDSRWKIVKSSNLNYLKCLDNTADNKDYDPPPPPPPPIYLFGNDNSDLEIHSILKYGPELTQESKNKIIAYLDHQYSGKGDRVSAEVIVKFVCTKEGTANIVTINKEIPKDMGFGNAVIDAMKLAKFKPAKESGGKAVSIRMSLKFYFYNREQNRIEIK